MIESNRLVHRPWCWWCVCAEYCTSTVADERASITAASIWWGGEFVFVPSGAGSECAAAAGSLLSEWMEPVFFEKKKKIK